MKSGRLHAERSQRLPNRRTAQHSGEVDPGPLAERAEIVRNYVIAAQALAGGNRTRASRMPRCASVRHRSLQVHNRRDRRQLSVGAGRRAAGIVRAAGRTRP